MKTKIILLFLVCISLNVIAQTQIDKPYDFPVKPGSSKWSDLSTGQEMVDVCQIPNSILKKMSTQALAQTCLNYPLFFQHTAFDDERKAIREIIIEFNGLSELSCREDGLIELIKLYKEIPVGEIQFLQINKEDVPYKGMYLELLLADDKFISKAKKIDLENIKSAYLDKYTEKIKRQDIYGLYGIRKILLLGAVVTLNLNLLNSTPNNEAEIKHFINMYQTAKADELTNISKIITAL